MRLQLWPFVVVAIFVGLSGCNPANPAPCPGERDMPQILEGFTVLSAPREGIPLGALWAEGVGPRGEGVSNEQLITSRSLSAAALNQSCAVRGSLQAAVLQRLNLNASGAAGVIRSVQFDSVSIVGIKDPASLGLATGRDYLFEAIKVKGFSITHASGATGEVESSLRQENLGQVQVGAAGGGIRTTSVAGTNLYIAYRVVGFEPGRTEVVAQHSDNSLLRYWQDTGYTFQFEEYGDNEYVPGPNWPGPHPTPSQTCGVKLSVESFHEFNEAGTPVVRNWRLFCYDTFEWSRYLDTASAVVLPERPRILTFSTRQTASGLIQDQIAIHELQLHIPNVEEPQQWYVRGRWDIRRQSLRLVPRPRASAPGWVPAL